MRILSVSITLALAIGAQPLLAAPAMWTPSPSPAKAQPRNDEQGFFSKLWFGDRSKAAAEARTQTVMGMRQPPTQTARGWNAIRSTFQPNPAQPAPMVARKPAPSELSPVTLMIKAQDCEMRRDIDGARRNLAQALAMNPNDPVTLREIGHFEDRQERLDVAEQMYRRAATSAPRDAGTLNDLALCCARQGKLEESAALLSSAISLRPEKTLYRNNIAKVLVCLRQTEAALRHLTAAHAPAAAQYNLGHLLEQNGDTVAAARCYQEAAAIDPQLAAANQAIDRLSAADDVQVATTTADPSPAALTDAKPKTDSEPHSEPWSPDEKVASEYSPLLLPPVRE